MIAAQGAVDSAQRGSAWPGATATATLMSQGPQKRKLLDHSPVMEGSSMQAARAR